MWEYIHYDELMHYGVKGMRWGVRKGRKSHGRLSTSRKTIQLGRSEYAHIMSELATNITREQRKQRTITKSIADHIYTFENNFDNTYRVIGKKRIPDSVKTLSIGGKKK